MVHSNGVVLALVCQHEYTSEQLVTYIIAYRYILLLVVGSLANYFMITFFVKPKNYQPI